MKGSTLTLLLVALILGASGCVTQKEAPTTPVTTPPPTAPPTIPSEPELSSEVEEIIGITEEATIPTETATSEILAPEFEVNATIDLGSVI